MSGALKTVLSLSVSGSAVILALLLCGALVRDRLSKRWQYYIWLAAVARLLLPLTPAESPVGALFQRGMEPPVSASASAPAPAPDVPALYDAAPVPEDGGATPVSGGMPAAAGRTADSWDILAGVWLIGALALPAWKAAAYWRFSRRVRSGCRAVSDPALLELLGQVETRAGLERPIGLYVNAMVSSPMLLGLFRPRIILTAPDLPEQELRYTLLHELVHCRRGDLAYKWLVQAAVCLHWFNPLVWLMAREINRVCELACDEGVLLALEPGERRAYGDMLLRAAAAGEGGGAFSAALSRSGKLLKERLRAIMNFRRGTPLTAAVSLVLAVVLTAGAAAAGAYRGPVSGGPAAPAERESREGDPDLYRTAGDLETLSAGGGERPETADSPEGETAAVVRNVNIPRLGPERNGIWWLGEYTLSRGDQIRYSISARTGETLQVGFAGEEEDPAVRSHYAVSRRRTGSVLRCAAGFSVSPEDEGSYRLFVRVPEGSAEGIRGHVVITPREELERRPAIPTAEQVLTARERALAGMTQEQVRRLKLVVREANLWWEHQYFYSNIFGQLEDPDDLYWNYFDKTGEIQIAWAYDGSLDKDAVCRQENLTEDQFYARYGTKVVTENRYTADDFVAILDELMESVRDESLRSALEYVREEARLAKEQHSMEHADNEYRALHDLDYFLLRYGPTDVGPYVIDDSTVTKYYGTLSIYGE